MGGALTPSRVRTPVVLVALLAVSAVIAVIALTPGGGGRRIFVTVREATNVVRGQEVRAAGVAVGSVAGLTPVRGGRAARIELRIDDRAWPITAGSTLTLRWGGTANYSNRYIALRRGPANAPAVADGGTLPASAFAVPVEFDQLLSTFPTPVRRQLRQFLDKGGVALRTARPDLRRALQVAPPAVQQASFVLHDLDADQAALGALVRSADNVVGAVDGAQPGVRELLTGARGTFSAIGDEAVAMREALERAPGTFLRARSTLARADRTLALAKDVTRRVAPGVTQVRAIARPLNSLLATVVRVGPDATSAVSSLRTSTPRLNPLLERVTALSPQIGRIGRQSVDNLNCIRPYTPDIAAFFSNWGDFFSVPDAEDKVFRAQVQQFLPANSNASVYNSAQAAKAFPELRYGFPRPPGTNAGQPWFLPECGAGQDALDPAKDPESRPFDQVMKLPPAQSGRSAR